MQEIMTFGVQLAKNAVDDYHAKTTTTTDDPRLHYVMASSGCYGAALADGSEYTGNYPPFMTFERLVDFHWKKASVLVEAQPDGLAIETIPSLDECQAACKMLQRLLLETNDKNKQTPHHDLAVWVSLACQNESQLNDGHSLLSALEAVRSMDPDAKLVHAIGINCCNPLFVPSLLKIMVKDMAIKGPLRGIVVYPNSGEEWDHINADWKEGTGVQSSEEFSQQIFEAMKLIQSVWQEETTRKKSDVVSKNYEGDQHCPKIIVGGCCRTSPRTIEKIRALVDELNLR
jgi:homocysteine S-methyltransferase